MTDPRDEQESHSALRRVYTEFKEFISRGNIVEVAVGVMIAGAFTGIINSLVSELFMPIVGLLTGGVDFNTWTVPLGTVTLNIGKIVTAIVNFFVLAIILFAIIKVLERMSRVKDFALEQVEQVLGSDDEDIPEIHPDDIDDEPHD